MNDNFLNNLMEEVKKADLRKKRQALLIQIAEKWEGHNFGAEPLHDRWIEGVCEEAIGYLTPEEIEALEATSDEEEEGSNSAQVGGEQIVTREFVIYLCRLYGVEAKDLAERED